MTRLTIKVLIALLTFTFGVGAAASWSMLRKSPPKEASHQPLPSEEFSLLPLPYCWVARNPGLYHGEVIRVRATLPIGPDGMYVFEDCAPVSALASLVELEGSEGAGARARNYVDEVLTDRTGDQIKEIQTIIVGRFDGEFSTGCWRPKYRIVATSIEKAAP